MFLDVSVHLCCNVSAIQGLSWERCLADWDQRCPKKGPESWIPRGVDRRAVGISYGHDEILFGLLAVVAGDMATPGFDIFERLAEFSAISEPRNAVAFKSVIPVAVDAVSANAVSPSCLLVPVDPRYHNENNEGKLGRFRRDLDFRIAH